MKALIKNGCNDVNYQIWYQIPATHHYLLESHLLGKHIAGRLRYPTHYIMILIFILMKSNYLQWVMTLQIEFMHVWTYDFSVNNRTWCQILQISLLAREKSLVV